MTAGVTLRLPEWVDRFLADQYRTCATLEDRMQFALDLAAENIRRQTGGPFGAAVFDAANGELLSVGVNVVLPSRCSVAHAEILALALAQQQLGSHDLASHQRRCQLVTSAEPCVMCLGAVHWAGLQSLACGARDEDVRAIGFDEGPKREDWADVLRQRGIEVYQDVLRGEAQEVLAAYGRLGGTLYNPGE